MDDDNERYRSQSGTPPAIHVRNLRKTYPGGVEAVKDISFDVAPGEVFGLLGPNGAGKSTTIGVLTTTVRPTSGNARVPATTSPRSRSGRAPPAASCSRTRCSTRR